MNQNETNWATIATWALDFTRATREMPILFRLLFRLIIGKYAYREFIGLQDALMREGYSPYFCYGLENIDYHKNSVPFDFAIERKL